MSGFGGDALVWFRDWLSENSAAYQSFNGNGTRQNLFGAQITNSFGSSLTAQLDMVRLWEKIDIETKNFQYQRPDPSPLLEKDIANYAIYNPTTTSRILGALRAIGAGNYQYFTQNSGIPGLRVTSEAERFAVNWNGYLTLMLGDSAQMNLKGDLMSVNRAVNTLTYASDIDKQSQWTAVDSAMKSFFYFVYCLSVLMKNVFDTVVEMYSSSMSATATLVVEIIEAIFLIFVPYYQNKWSKELLYNEKTKAQAFIADDSETAVMQDEFKRNSDTLKQLIDSNTTALMDLQNAKGSLDNEIAGFKQELAKLQADCDAYKANVQKSQAEVDALKTKLEGMQKTFEANTRTLVDELNALQASMELDRLGFTSAMNGLSEKYNQKLEELTAIVNSEMDRLNDLKAETEEQIAKLNEEYEKELAKVKAMVAEGDKSNLLAQVGMQYQVKATQYNMALQGYFLLQQNIMIAIQEQKTAKILNRSIEEKTVVSNITNLEQQLDFILIQTSEINGKLTDLPLVQDQFIAQMQSTSGVGVATTNGDGASELNPSAAGIAALLAGLDADIKAEQEAMSTLLIAKGNEFNDTLLECVKALDESAGRSLAIRAAHKTTKMAEKGLRTVGESATLIGKAFWR